MLLQSPKGNGVFRFDLKHEGTETIRLNAQLFLTGLLCGLSGRNDADLAEDAHLAMLAH